MNNKTIRYIGLGVIILLFFGTFAMGAMNGISNKKNNNVNSGETYDEMQIRMHPDQQINNNVQVKYSNIINLSKYRRAPIPEDCRLADYDNDVKGWVEHLGHHANTKYCLEYYKDFN